MTRVRGKQQQLERLQNIANTKSGKLLSTEFVTAKTKYTFECEHGHIFELTSDKIVSRGDWCPYCAGRYGDFDNKYEEIIKSHGGKKLSPYVNGHTNIQCECENGHEFYITPNNLLAGKWCKACNVSHGERAIENYLKSHHIHYMKEYTFKDLKGDRNVLPFDFAVFVEDKLICLIEYDGEQHYRPMRHSHNKQRNIEKFYQTQFYDGLKNAYCEEHQIPLIRISCFDVDYRRLNNLQRDVDCILDNKLDMLISVPSLNSN